MLCVNDNDYAYVMMYTLDPLLSLAVSMMQLQNSILPYRNLRLLLNTGGYYICHQVKH
jgi:hypothetical protein